MLRIRIRCFLDPWIRYPGWKKSRSRIQDGKNLDTGSRINIPDLIFENFVSVFWVKKYLNSLSQIQVQDLVNPRSGIRDGKVGSGKHPGSAALLLSYS
jgi:hypothetical protein